MSDPLRLDAVAQADLVRRGAISPLELTDAAIARIEALNPRLNAMIHPLFDKARALAASPDLPDGPFRGVPFLVKDLICQTAGDPLHEGMRFLRNRGWRAQGDSYLAAKLRAAGFVFAGKTNTSELGLLPTTEPEAYGPTRNPWDLDRSTGGSSGGSAAAVAAGMTAVAHANDLAGSIRIPSSLCGLVGLKPSRGRTSLGPFWDILSGLVVEHVVTRSVRDTAAILDMVCGPMPGDPYRAPPPMRPFALEAGMDPGRLRIGVLTRARGNDVHPDCAAAARDAGMLLESLGHSVEESSPEGFDAAVFYESYSVLFVIAATYGLKYWSRRTGTPITREDVEPLTWALAEIGTPLPVIDYLTAVERLHGWARGVAAWWDGGFDLLLTPTVAEPPPPLGTFAPKPDNPLAGGIRSAFFTPFTPAFNVTGQPAISLPVHWSAGGLPIGIQLAAAYGREDLLIRVASQLERARPWAERRPPLSA